MASKIKHCSACRPGLAAAYQDAAYSGKRVMNETKDGKLRCTVCGREVKE